MAMNRTHQYGITLIGMMIGMVISMVVILGMLTVYKTTSRVSGEAGRSAATDGQRLAGLFTAQTLLQGAGYGITSAASGPAVFGTDLVVVSGATLSTQLSGTAAAALPANGNAIVWGSKTASGVYTCNGLYAPLSGGLIRLTVNQCNTSAAASWNTVAWTQTELVHEQKLSDQDSTTNRAVTIQVSSASPSCQPFGIAGSGSLLVKLLTKNSTSTGQPVTATTCLSNF